MVGHKICGRAEGQCCPGRCKMFSGFEHTQRWCTLHTATPPTRCCGPTCGPFGTRMAPRAPHGAAHSTPKIFSCFEHKQATFFGVPLPVILCISQMQRLSLWPNGVWERHTCAPVRVWQTVSHTGRPLTKTTTGEIFCTHGTMVRFSEPHQVSGCGSGAPGVTTHFSPPKRSVSQPPPRGVTPWVQKALNFNFVMF